MKLDKKKALKITLIGIPVLLILLLLSFCIYILSFKQILQYDNIIRSSEKYCITGNFFLPSLYKITYGTPVEIETEETVTIFNKFDIFAKSICIQSQTLLPENSLTTLSLTFLGNTGLQIFNEEISIPTEEYPKVSEAPSDRDFNISESISYEITNPNPLLQYKLLEGENETLCSLEESTLHCNLEELELQYGGEYELTLISTYNSVIVDELDSSRIETLEPVKIVSTNIKQGGTIYDLNPKIVLSTNKPVDFIGENTLENSEGVKTQLVISTKDNTITVEPKSPLSQKSTYTLTLGNLKAEDGSELTDPFTLKFKIGDGPRPRYTNISGYGFPTGSNIYITFDQDLKSNQDISKKILLSDSTTYTYSISNNRISINPKTSLKACKTYSLVLKQGILSDNELSSSQEYTYTFKTKCARIVTLGSSVQSRPIYAYYFGTGSKKIVFFGAMHGSEAKTKDTMLSWIAELEKNSSKIPSDKTVIVVPTFNPDGIANQSRFNANKVDINRNFDTSDWSPDSYFLSKKYVNGGGTEPFSEPETRLIRNLITNNHPYLTLSYHSAASYTIPCGTSKSFEYGTIYSQLSGYRYVPPEYEDAFSYTVTGSLGTWAKENGYNELTIEVSSPYVDEFSRNVKAMWKMVTM